MSSDLNSLVAVADAIDLARYQHPQNPRERPRPFNEACPSDQEYAIRLAGAAIAALPAPAGVEVTELELAMALFKNRNRGSEQDHDQARRCARTLLSTYTILAKPAQEGQK